MSRDRIHDAVLCAERRGRTPARSIDAAIVTGVAYGCNCRSANGNTTTVRQSIFPACGGNSPGLRNGVMHAPMTSQIATSVRPCQLSEHQRHFCQRSPSPRCAISPVAFNRSAVRAATLGSAMQYELALRVRDLLFVPVRVLSVRSFFLQQPKL